MRRRNGTGRKACRGLGIGFALTALSVAALLPVGTAAASSAEAWGGPNEQPRLSTPIPAAVAPGAFGGADFDDDGVVNRKDNCLLVPNAEQKPAVRPAGVKDDPLAAEWRQANPKAAFRTNAELGQACSGWNGNWRRTQKAQMIAPDPLKHRLYRYLGEGGPMFGPDTLVHGGPVCADWNTGWLAMGAYWFGFPAGPAPIPAEFSCPNGQFVEPGQDFVAAHIWGGKRLFTPTNAGGEITNRFFPSMSEQPIWNPMLPYAPEQFFPHKKPQTVLGHVIRGRSYVDGRPTIIMDWRRTTGSNFGGYPVANTGMPGFGEFLVYDECRGLQTGIWTCNANADIVKPNGDRKLFQFGWMMWQSIDPDIAAFEAWERDNPEWTKPETYGFPQ